MATSNLVELTEQLRTAIWTAFIAWAFAPVLCRAVRHGEVVLTIHDSQLRDVHIDFSSRPIKDSPKPT